MAKFLIDLNVDGYQIDEEHNEACKEFIESRLDYKGSSIKVLGILSQEWLNDMINLAKRETWDELDYDKKMDFVGKTLSRTSDNMDGKTRLARELLTELGISYGL